MEVVSQYDESAVEEYQGQYEDGEDFAYQMIDEIGLENFNNPQYFVDISDTDRRIMAQEMADSYTDDIADEGKLTKKQRQKLLREIEININAIKLKKEIQTVPVVVIYNGNKPVRQWSADLSFKLEVDLNEIQKTVNSIR